MTDPLLTEYLPAAVCIFAAGCVISGFVYLALRWLCRESSFDPTGIGTTPRLSEEDRLDWRENNPHAP